MKALCVKFEIFCLYEIKPHQFENKLYQIHPKLAVIA